MDFDIEGSILSVSWSSQIEGPLRVKAQHRLEVMLPTTILNATRVLAGVGHSLFRLSAVMMQGNIFPGGAMLYKSAHKSSHQGKDVDYGA
jgi:hypothetical protein